MNKKNKYMIWAITSIRDVLNYQTGEQLDEHLDLLVHWLGVIEEKQEDFSEDDLKHMTKEILETGLSILPVTQKAVDRYERP